MKKNQKQDVISNGECLGQKRKMFWVILWLH